MAIQIPSPDSIGLDLALRAAEHDLAAATPEHWMRRAVAFERARPQVNTSGGTPLTRAAVNRHHRLGELAAACRAHATIVAPTREQVDAVTVLALELAARLDQEIDDLIAQTHRTIDDAHGRREIQHFRLHTLAGLIARRNAAAARIAAAGRVHVHPDTPPLVGASSETTDAMLARHRRHLAAHDQQAAPPIRGVA